MNLEVGINNRCIEQKDFCTNCDSHFRKVRPLIKTVAVSGRFERDLKDGEMVNSIIRSVLDCSHLEFHELHKFEMNVDGNLIFRAKKEKMHIIYSVDKLMRIAFLRAITNFAQYKKFLDDKKAILRMINRVI